MSRYGPWCGHCGHPSTFHGAKWCVHPSGSDHKRACDCPGYTAPRCECGWTTGNHYHDMRMARASEQALEAVTP